MNPAESQLVGFRSHLRAETVPAEAVYLISARRVTALSGRVHPAARAAA